MIQLKSLGDIYSNEQAFLLLLTRVYFLTSNIDELEDFIKSRSINWELTYKIARSHSMRPFVYHVIFLHQLDVPVKFKSKLRQDCDIALQKNMMQALAAAEITGELKKQGIDVISYKGALFASRYYESLAMRESVDIDFLADQKDIAGIEDYFINKGFLLKEGVPRRYLTFYSRFFKDIVYRIPKCDCNVEIHWSLLNKFAGKYPSYAFFKPNSTPYKTKFGECTVLYALYDFLAISSNHLVKDMSTRFKYLIDIGCILSKHPDILNDPIILETAEKYGFKKKLKKGLSLVSELIGINIPGNYLAELNAEDISIPLAYPIAIRKFQFNDQLFIKRSLALQDNFKNKIRLLLSCFSYFFIPSYLDINAYRLPAVFLPLLFVLRPFRLIAQKIRARGEAVSFKKN